MADDKTYRVIIGFKNYAITEEGIGLIVRLNKHVKELIPVGGGIYKEDDSEFKSLFDVIDVVTLADDAEVVPAVGATPVDKAPF